MSLRSMSMLLSTYRLKARAVSSGLPPQRKLDDQDASHTPKNVLATPYRTIRLWRWLTLVSFLFLLATAFRAGWQRAETDFPNYYTAAVMVRKREPLRNYYDWTSFQREINYAGTERQLGGYYPNTPLTMLPLAGLTFLPVQPAKQIWLLCNLAFLMATVWLLSRASRFSLEQIWLLAFCGYFSLRTNFLYGQYYLLLLFLLTLAFYLLQKGQTSLSGLVTGVAFGLKLYGGPFLLFFVVRRKWKAFAAMSGAVSGLAILAIGLFGWSDVHYYVTRVFPRSLEGNAIDPYTTAASTLSNLLRHAFVSEPELNPHPVWNQPGLFFFLNALSRLAIAAFVCIGLAMKPRSDRRDFAWFMLATILLSPNSASYMFILILLPLVLLLEDSGEKESIFLIASYVLLTLSPHPARLFPKVWILLAMVITIGAEYWRPLRPRLVVNLGLSCILIAFVVSRRQTVNYRKEPAMRFEPMAVEKGEVFSSFPAISRAGLFYQAIGKDRYVLHWLHDNRIEELLFDGHALHPLAPTPDGRIYFELVAHGVSRMMEFDPLKRSVAPSSTAVPLKDADSALSPDGKWLAFTSDTTGSKQVWLRDVATGRNSPLTRGNCNNSSPAWDLDSRSVVFASDCGRGFGLTALYRAPIPSGHFRRGEPGHAPYSKNAAFYNPQYRPSLVLLGFASRYD